MPRKKQNVRVYDVSDEAQVFFLEKLTDYFRFFLEQTSTEAEESAKRALDNIICGLDKDGKEIKNPNLEYLDDVISVETQRYYVPNERDRLRFKKGTVKAKPIVAPNQPKNGIDLEKLEQIKRNLVSAYPALDRLDLAQSVDNYCRLQLSMATELASQHADSKRLNELTLALTRLGSFLGIDETLKAKQREEEDRQSVAALALAFQRTLEQYPEMIERMRYKEVRILLERYDRQELSREIFELPSHGGMSIEKAREFIRSKEKEFEAA